MLYALFISLALLIANQLSAITLVELVSEQSFPMIYTDMYGYNVLDLSNKNIHDIGNIHLLPVLFKAELTPLYRIPNCKLDLSDNQLETLDESFAFISGLKILFVSDNNLSTLPATIYLAKDLEALYASRNNITSLPESIGLLTQLQTVDLSANHLTQLPESIALLPNLTHLFVNDNSLRHMPLVAPWLKLDARNNPCTRQEVLYSFDEEPLDALFTQDFSFDNYAFTPAQLDLQSDY